MRCLECGSEAVTERPERTAQGYRRFRCGPQTKGLPGGAALSERGVFFRLQPRPADRVVSPHQTRASSSGLITRGES
jgi:hypothetical protein